MFICSFTDVPVGSYVQVDYLPEIDKKLDPPQPAIIKRHATRQEYRDFCISIDSELFLRNEKKYGPVDAPFFYEIETD